MMPVIIWLRGTSIGQEFPLGSSELTIGRSSENSIAVGSGLASRFHASIRPDAGGYLLVDLESANGTRVNGQRIQAPYRLVAGDLFEIGEELFRFHLPEPGQVGTLAAAPALLPVQLPAVPPAAPSRPLRLSRRVVVVLLLVLIIVIAGLVLVTNPGRSGVIPTDVSGTTSQSIGAGQDGTAALVRAGPGGKPSGRAWTVLVYMAADNDLEYDAWRDLNEIEQVGSNDQLTILVQLDTNGRTGDASTRRLLMQRDGDQQTVSSPILVQLGEQNTGDPQTLADFLVWGVRAYPADHYALVIWDHGSAWAGIAFDNSAAGDGLTLPELAAALQTAQAQLDGLRFDLLGFDACLMAQLDVFVAVAPFARTVVASAELEPNDGWSWDTWLAELQRTPTMDNLAVARAAVETYRAAYQPGDQQTATLSAFDLAAIEAVRTATDRFARAMVDQIEPAYRPMAEARSYVTLYSQPRTEEFSAVDLGDLARLAIERGIPEPAASHARTLVAAIDAARIANWAGTFHARSTGMSAYFPESAQRMPDLYEQVSPLARDTGWASFVRQFQATADARSSAPRITQLQVTPDPAGGATLQGTVAGADIAGVFFFVGIPNADRSSVQLTDIAYVQPPGGFDDAGNPHWDAGPHQITERWNAFQWELSNGETTIPVLLGPARAGTDLYGVEGLYQSASGGESIEAALLFQRNGDSTSLLSVYGFPREQGRAAQPFELRPNNGDLFTVQFRTYSIDGTRLVPGRVNGETIRFGAQPLQAVPMVAPSATYVAGFLVRDINGQFQYEYRDLQLAP